jgi:hypothetical protein
MLQCLIEHCRHDRNPLVPVVCNGVPLAAHGAADGAANSAADGSVLGVLGVGVGTTATRWSQSCVGVGVWEWSPKCVFPSRLASRQVGPSWKSCAPIVKRPTYGALVPRGLRQT